MNLIYLGIAGAIYYLYTQRTKNVVASGGSGLSLGTTVPAGATLTLAGSSLPFLVPVATPAGGFPVGSSYTFNGQSFVIGGGGTISPVDL